MNNPLKVFSDFVFVKNEIAPADIIFVPGSLSPQLMVKAAELWHKGYAPLILPSGGSHYPIANFSSEWEFLQHHGVANGIPTANILREDQARNTFENANFSLAVLNANNIKIKTAIMVCKAFHSRRALLTYQTVFVPPIKLYMVTVPCANNLSADNWFLTDKGISVVMQEIKKIGNYFASEVTGFTRDFPSTSCSSI